MPKMPQTQRKEVEGLRGEEREGERVVCKLRACSLFFNFNSDVRT